MLERNIHVRLNELFFPAKHGALLEDGSGGVVPASEIQKELWMLLQSQGFEAGRVHVSDLAANVIDAAMGRGGAAHYSQLSTMAHAALPMIAIHMDSRSMRNSRTMLITAAVDMASPLVFVVRRIQELFDIQSQHWPRTALQTIDLLADYNASL